MAGLTRRSLLRRGLLGGALLAAGGGTWLALRDGRLRPLPATPLQALDPVGYAVLAAVVERILPDPPANPTVRDRVPLAIDGLLANSDERTRRDFGQLLRLFDNALAGFVLDGRPTPFTRLDAAEQDAALAAWQTSRLAVRRSGYQALKRLTLSAYYAQPETFAAAAYPGPPTDILRVHAQRVEAARHPSAPAGGAVDAPPALPPAAPAPGHP